MFNFIKKLFIKEPSIKTPPIKVESEEQKGDQNTTEAAFRQVLKDLSIKEQWVERMDLYSGGNARIITKTTAPEYGIVKLNSSHTGWILEVPYAFTDAQQEKIGEASRHIFDDLEEKSRVERMAEQLSKLKEILQTNS